MPAMEQLSAAGTQYLVARLLANAKGGNAASSSYPNQDWYKTYACGTRGRPRTWEPLVPDLEGDSNLDIIQVNHRLLNQIKDGAVKHEMSFLEVSPTPRWVLTGLFLARLIAVYYELRGEARLTHYQKHILDCAKRSVPEFERVKRIIEAKGGIGLEIWSSWETSGARVSAKEDWLLMDFDVVIGKKPGPDDGKTADEDGKKPKAQGGASKKRGAKANSSSDEDAGEDWCEALSRRIMEQCSIWSPENDTEAENHIKIIEGNLRILAYMRDAAATKRKSLVHVSPHQRWITGALFSIDMSVYMYEQRGEGSLSHFQRHVLQTGRRALQDFKEVKRREEAKSGIGCDVWGTQDGLDDVFIPLGVTDELIQQKFGTTFNKTPNEWVGKSPKKAEESAPATSSRQPRVAATPPAPSNRAERRRMAKESGANKSKATKSKSNKQSKPATPQPAASRGSASDDADDNSDVSSCRAYEL